MEQMRNAEVLFIFLGAMRMNNLFRVWLSKEAKWWKFWLPQSGLFGGMIAAALISAAILLVAK